MLFIACQIRMSEKLGDIENVNNEAPRYKRKKNKKSHITHQDLQQ